MPYLVHYEAVGCLPDSTYGPFDTIEDAAEHIQGEVEYVLYMDFDTRSGDNPPEVPGVSEIAREYGYDDPTEGSLYSWEIVPITDEEAEEWGDDYED